MGLWMVRSNPGELERISDFLEDEIISVHWGIGDLTNCLTRKDVAAVVAKNTKLKPRDANLKTGLLYRFALQMDIGDYCIVPIDKVFYIGVITSDYYFDQNSVKFEHQRKVEWLFDGEPFDRTELPKQIQSSLKSQLGLVDLNKHKSIFENYLNIKQGLTTTDPLTEYDSVEGELNSLLPDAIKTIKEEINSDDPDRRLKAAIAVLKFSQIEL